MHERLYVEYTVECACVRVCVPGARREVLAASLGTYKPCGRICLRCQLKAFSNVHPTPSPGMGEVRGSGTQSCLLLTSPCQAWGHSWGLHHPLSWPSLFPDRPKAEAGKAAAASPPLLPGGRPRILSPPGHHFVTATETATKWGRPGCAWADLARGPLGGNGRGQIWLPPRPVCTRGPGENGSLPLE